MKTDVDSFSVTVAFLFGSTAANEAIALQRSQDNSQLPERPFHWLHHIAQPSQTVSGREYAVHVPVEPKVGEQVQLTFSYFNLANPQSPCDNPTIGAVYMFKAKYTFTKDYGFKTHATRIIQLAAISRLTAGGSWRQGRKAETAISIVPISEGYIRLPQTAFTRFAPMEIKRSDSILTNSRLKDTTTVAERRMTSCT
ncbi:hypothetical protein BV898_02534 [Hypsibius exemplaris]|uniref:Uncharacterized protein n=1 Tax=Hypsibius exemplaris TaxID=2072580 RepID=A0A1W0X7X1_HYPEX|nr:hypothetical protein BV898_02534 [Hypsibius exemplaris]